MVTARSLFSSRLVKPVAPEDVEDSILLRVLVQVLVTLGIGSVAVAASGVTDTSQWNLLAIPASAVGAWFSWKRRRYRNLAVKFFNCRRYAHGPGGIFQSPDCRPRRHPHCAGRTADSAAGSSTVLTYPAAKDLGYSMMIGLILLGVAATISQTLAFAAAADSIF